MNAIYLGTCQHCGAEITASDLTEAVTALQDHYSTCAKLPKVGKDPGRITARKHTRRN